MDTICTFYRLDQSILGGSTRYILASSRNILMSIHIFVHLHYMLDLLGSLYTFWYFFQSRYRMDMQYIFSRQSTVFYRHIPHIFSEKRSKTNPRDIISTCDVEYYSINFHLHTKHMRCLSKKAQN
jgi:hypothetical protein